MASPADSSETRPPSGDPEPSGDRGGWVTPGVRTASEWAWRLGAIGLAGYGLILVLQVFSQIIIALLVSLLLAALLNPLVNLLARFMKRGLASFLALILAIAFIALLVTIVAQQTTSGFPDLRDQAAKGIEEFRGWLNDGPLGIDSGTLSDYVGSAQKAISDNRDDLISGALGAANTVSHLVEGLFIALFSTFFFLASGQRIWGWLLRMLPRRTHDAIDEAARASWVTLSSYVRATLIVALIDGIGIGVGAAVLSVPLAVPIGVLVFLGAFIPIVGALITGAVAVLVALVAEGPFVALLMLGVVLLVQQFESHVLQPFLMGRAVSVHPLAVILAIAAGATLAGIVGALFAVPTVAVANTFITSLARQGRPPDGADPPPGERVDPGTDDGDDSDDEEPLAAAPPPIAPDKPRGPDG